MKGYSVNTGIIVFCGVRFSLHIGAYGTLAKMCKEGRVAFNSTPLRANFIEDNSFSCIYMDYYIFILFLRTLFQTALLSVLCDYLVTS